MATSLWIWGDNQYGQLGDGSRTNKSSPIALGSDKSWAQVALNQALTLGITSNGELWATGYGHYGAFCDGTSGVTAKKSSPVRIGDASDWESISIGYYHATLAIKTNGTLWAWSYGGHYGLGLGNLDNYSSPVQVGANTDWKQVSVGKCVTHAVTDDGKLYAWGSTPTPSTYGYLGLGSTTSASSPIQVGALTTWSSVYNSKCETDFATFAIKTDGTLWAWGQQVYGALGNNTNSGDKSSPIQVGSATDWKMIGNAGAYSVGVKTDGTLWGWGYNGTGLLGLGDTTNRSTPVQVGAGTNWDTVSFGGSCFFATKTDGTLWLIGGTNTYGSFGLGDSNTALKYSSPVQIGSKTTWSSLCDTGINIAAALEDATAGWTTAKLGGIASASIIKVAGIAVASVKKVAGVAVQ